LDVLFMVLFQHLFGVSGIAWATPAADWIAFVISLLFIIPFLRSLRIGRNFRQKG